MKFYFEGDVVSVKGLTQKGRNRVNEHGDKWVISRVKDTDVLLQSGDYLKWNYASNPDFEIVEHA